MVILTDRDRWWIREMILRGDNPVRRFQQASRKAQVYGLAVVVREGVVAARVAIVSGVPGVALVLSSLLLLGFSAPLLIAGGALSFVALIAALVAWRRSRAIQRLYNAQVFTAEHLAVGKRISGGGSLSAFAAQPKPNRHRKDPSNARSLTETGESS